MSSGPFSEMQPEDCKKHLDAEETPLIRFVPTEPVAREVIHKTLYNADGQKDSSMEVPIFDGTGPAEDLIRWWTQVTKYFKLANVTRETEKFRLVPTFLADGGTVQGLWEDERDEVAKIQIHP